MSWGFAGLGSVEAQDQNGREATISVSQRWTNSASFAEIDADLAAGSEPVTQHDGGRRVMLALGYEEARALAVSILEATAASDETDRSDKWAETVRSDVEQMISEVLLGDPPRDDADRPTLRAVESPF